MAMSPGGWVPDGPSQSLKVVYTTEPESPLEIAYDEPVWCSGCWHKVPFIALAYHREHDCVPRPCPWLGRLKAADTSED